MRKLIIASILSVAMIFLIIIYPRNNYRVCWEMEDGKNGYGKAKFSQEQAQSIADWGNSYYSFNHWVEKK